MTLGPTGHYVGSPGIKAHIVYVALHDDGSQRTCTPHRIRREVQLKERPGQGRVAGEVVEQVIGHGVHGDDQESKSRLRMED